MSARAIVRTERRWQPVQLETTAPVESHQGGAEPYAREAQIVGGGGGGMDFGELQRTEIIGTGKERTVVGQQIRRFKHFNGWWIS